MYLGDWRPSAQIATLKARAKLLADIRQFFALRNVFEVETPLRAKYTVTAPHLASFCVQQDGAYLQTSPEYAMKRLLAAGSGCIYQICKAFRQDERGTRHNSEFTLLEWYRLDFSYQQLMQEVADLVCLILGDLKIESISYRDAFLRYADIDPFIASTAALKKKAAEYIEFEFGADSTDDYLDLLQSHCIEQNLGRASNGARTICFLTDFPASQAALAVTQRNNYGEVAQRFEVFVEGMELVNAYRELGDAQLLAQRWEQDRARRLHNGLPDIEADHYLLAAQQHGLPECCGAALGVDRLMMLASGVDSIEQVISFSDERA